MVERMWFGSKLIGEGNGVVRLGPIAAVAEHGIDLCARGERRDTLTNLFDHSREITSGDRQGARAACRGLVGLVPLQFSGDDPCRVDAQKVNTKASTSSSYSPFYEDCSLHDDC